MKLAAGLGLAFIFAAMSLVCFRSKRHSLALCFLIALGLNAVYFGFLLTFPD